MKKLIKKIEDIMVAITFAEAGEYDEANRLAGNEIRLEQGDAESLHGLKRKTAFEGAGK